MKKDEGNTKVTFNLKSDALFKAIMESKVAAREFLEEYLPVDVQKLLDLTQISVEKESFVEEDLKRRLSDIVYSIPTLNNNKAYVFCLLEHQSTPDKWIALRLWKYAILLLERHKDQDLQLPIIIPLVIYQGKKKYTAPRSFWDLFYDPDLAKRVMGDGYQLIDLNAMSDDEINKEKHIALVQHFWKHIHTRDAIQLWRKCLTEFKDALLIDMENGYLYLKPLLWYTDAIVDEKEKEALKQLLKAHLPNNDGEKIMTTIAESYINEGMQRGIELGKEEGREEEKLAVAKNMLKAKIDVKLIASITGLSEDEVKALASV